MPEPPRRCRRRGLARSTGKIQTRRQTAAVGRREILLVPFHFPAEEILSTPGHHLGAVLISRPCSAASPRCNGTTFSLGTAAVFGSAGVSALKPRIAHPVAMPQSRRATGGPKN